MLPLAGSSLPTSPETLADALKGGMEACGVQPCEVAASGTWPALENLRIDVTGAHFDLAKFSPLRAEDRASGFSVKEMQLVAAPAMFGAAAADFALVAEDAEFDVSPNVEGRSVLAIRRAAQGSVRLEMEHAAVEKLAHQLIVKAAGEHGVEIKATTLRITVRGPRALSLNAEITAKMFVATAAVRVSGDLDVDDQLNARISNLRFDGDGMIANLAGGIVRPQLARFEGRVFPLMTFAVGEIRLRDVQLESGATLRLTARIGS
jgi:hypothetical protein